jgi:hypothetical protein
MKIDLAHKDKKSCRKKFGGNGVLQNRSLDALRQDVEVDGGAHVVDVGHEAVLPALIDQLVQDSGIVNGLIKVTVTRRIKSAKKWRNKICAVWAWVNIKNWRKNSWEVSTQITAI